MKVGDLIQYESPNWTIPEHIGTIIEFLQVSHHKEVQKVLVLTENGPKLLIMQYCKVINESR